MPPSDATMDVLITAIENGDLTPEQAAEIAATLPAGDAPEPSDES